jgi:hypothetical protein
MQTGKYKHHQIWADPSTVEPRQWRNVQAMCKWVANPPLEKHAVDGWFSHVGVGPLCWHQHIDLCFMALAHRVGDLLCGLRGESGATVKLPEVADRPTIKKAVEARVALVGPPSTTRAPKTELCEEAPLSKKRGKHNNAKNGRNHHERVHNSYKNGTWKERALGVVEKLEAKGLSGILDAEKFAKVIENMQKL